jgi:hypothetical protein
MTLEILTILAIIIGPIAAVQAQAWVEKKSGSRERQRAIYTQRTSRCEI